MQKQKRVISLVLALMLALSCVSCLGSVSAFAAENTTLQVGDANGDGEVDIDDVTYMQQHLAGRQPGASDEQIKAMDTNGDGDVDMDDVTLLQYFLAGRAELVEPTEPATEAPTEVTEAPETTPDEPTEEPTEVTEEPTEVTEEPTEVVEPTEEPTEVVEPTEEPTEPAEEHIYSVAGSVDALGSWDATNVSTEMTKGDDGIYTFTTALDAQEGAMFKIVEDHSWDVAYGDNGNNVVFNVKSACDVTITFDPETKEINVTGDGVEYPITFEIEAIRAVGNGDGNWLNGSAWDPADDINMMTEVADGIYEISFENIDASFSYSVKCAANGSWAANWGIPKDSGFTPENGVAFDAGWDGDNAVFEVEEDGATVKVQLDLTNFDYASKSGAKMTITVIYPGEEPTEEPTEVVEPTEEPTEVVEPTEEPTEPAEEHIYSVAGSVDALGSWDATNVSTEMTKGDDGIYTFTTALDAQEGAMFKIVEDHSWDVAYGDNGNNVVFNVKSACDVTITFDPETKEINVTGDGVEYPITFEIEAIRAVGNGDGNWLNGSAWDPADDINMMTEVADGVYEIKFENIDASFSYSVKCAANGSWAANWGIPKDSGFTPENGVAFDAGWDGDNAVFEVEEDGATVTIQLDLTNFDYASKSGAKMTITVDYPGEEPTEEPTEVVEPTEEPTEVVEPTEEPTEPAEEHIYSVAGSVDALGSWDATNVSTEMTKGDDGVYTFTTALDAQEGAMFKIVEDHSWDVAYGDNGNNVVFNVKSACDVTITFDPETKEINVTGDGVEYPITFEIEAIRAVGNGDGNWLNGSAWDPADDINMMTEVADGVYEIKFENIDASFSYSVKCAANGSWAANWGIPKDSGFTPENGVAFDAGWDGDNAVFEVEDDGATVTVQLDLTNFDYASKTGAKMTITVDYPED